MLCGAHLMKEGRAIARASGKLATIRELLDHDHVCLEIVRYLLGNAEAADTARGDRRMVDQPRRFPDGRGADPASRARRRSFASGAGRYIQSTASPRILSCAKPSGTASIGSQRQHRRRFVEMDQPKLLRLRASASSGGRQSMASRTPQCFLAVALPTIVWTVFLTPRDLRGHGHALPAAGEERSGVPPRVRESRGQRALLRHARRAVRWPRGSSRRCRGKVATS